MTMKMDPEELRRRAEAGDANAAFELGRWYAGQGNFRRARRWWREAADGGCALAHTELGLHALFGFDETAGPREALARFIAGAAGGSPEAHYRLAMLRATGILLPYEPKAIDADLKAAGDGGFAPALRALGLIRRERARDEAEHARARSALEQAAALGDPIGERLASLAATSPAPPQAVTWRVLSESPLVRITDGVLDPLECEALIALGAPHLKPSVGFDSALGRVTHSRERTSYNVQFGPVIDDFIVLHVTRRMLDAIGVPVGHAEPLDLLRYQPGQEYRPHRDYLPPSDPSTGRAPHLPGQRVHTVFAYLTDVDEGGETAFPQLELMIAPKRGRLVHFVNLDATGAPDPRTLHAGCPVVRGEKWLATIWTRERAFRRF
jgi:hypothetical protein